MSNREFTATRTMLANAMATAGAELLSYMGVSSALAAIPNTEPPQYVVAGTLAMIAKVLPAAPVPPLTAPAPLTDELKQLRNRVSELEAARITYASEFPLTADGEPDVGNIHANIRALKTKAAPAPQQSEGLSDERILGIARYQCVRETMNSTTIAFARAIEREIRAKAAPAAPVQTAEPVIFDDFPEFNAQAMGCGLEDRGITDRYDAMRYGFEEALDLVDERIKNFLADFVAPSVAAPVQAEQAQAEPKEGAA